MVNRVDGVILGVGIVVLVASVIGVILYDEQSPQEYTISWGQSEAIEMDEQTDSGGAGEYSFATNVTEEHLARAEFTVEVTASGTNVEDSNVDVEIQTPGEETDTCSFTVAGGQTSSTNDCSVEFELNPRPQITSANGINASDAESQAIEEAELTNGTGEWATTVTISTGAGLSDPDYDISLTPTVYTWDATAAQQGPGGRAG